MKRISTKIISIFLAAVLLCVPSLTALASATDVNHSCPSIYVHGIMSSTIYEDPNDPESKVAWPPSSDLILSNVKDILPSLAKFAVTWDWDALADAIVPVANNILSGANCMPDGTTGNKSGVRFTYPDAASITKASDLTFTYDWRLDPMEIAVQLNDFINYVLDASGCKQVTLKCHSLGGVVTLSYITLYGDSKLKSIALNTTAIYGETYTGELMNGKIALSADAVEEFLRYILDGIEYENLYNGLICLLNEAGLLDIVCMFGDKLVEEIAYRVLPEVIVPMFGNWLSIWAMVPDADLQSGMDYVFNEIYKNSNTDFTALKAKINNYTNTVRNNKTQTLLTLNDHINLYVISRYGYCSIPITPSWRNLSDGVVDTMYSSMGATTALYGETLSNEYLANKNEKFISPGSTIDTSTCLFPEQTWLVKYLKHSDNVDDLDDMIDNLLYYDGQATIDTFEEYPQFLLYDYDTNTITADTTEDLRLTFVEKITLMLEDLKTLFLYIINLIRNYETR